MSCSTKVLQTGRRSGSAPRSSFWLLSCCRPRSREAQDEQRDRERRSRDIVEHDDEGRAGQADQKQLERWTNEVEHRGAERDGAEDAGAEQRDRHPPREAEPGGKPGFAGYADRRLLDHQVAQIERIAEREEANGQQHVGLPRGRKEWSSGHRATLARARK